MVGPEYPAIARTKKGETKEQGAVSVQESYVASLELDDVASNIMVGTNAKTKFKENDVENDADAAGKQDTRHPRSGWSGI